MHLGGVISAFAEDFKPTQGVKYLIKCNLGDNFAIYNSTCYKGSNDNTVILSYWTQTDNRSEFTIEYVSSSDAYYIKSATADNIYAYAIDTENANSNVGIKAFDTPDESCLWTISFQNSTKGFVIKPKGGSNGWNCRGSYGGNNHIGQWNNNGTDNNTWRFIPSTLTSGYYTLKNCATDRPTYYFNDFTYAPNTAGVTMGAQSLPTTLPNGYIWHVVNNKGVLTVTNGQGGDAAIKADDGTTTSTLTVMAYTNGGYIFDSYLNAGKGRPVGSYQRLTTWAAGGITPADNLWNFNSIDAFDEANIYNVEVNIPTGYAKLTATSEAAKNGGFFYLTTAPTASDFAAGDVAYMSGTVSVEGHTIKVNYTGVPETLKTAAENAETNILSKEGLGYPLHSSTEYRNLEQAIANAKVASADQVYALGNTFDAALSAYINTSNIQMPEDGKAYRMAYIYNDGVKQYLYWNGSRIAAKQADQITDENTSIFVCHKKDDKYIFATNQGTYLSWMDNGNANKSYNLKGVTESYIAQNAWTVEPADANGNGGTVTAARADLFGRMQMKALDKEGKNYYYLNARHSTGANINADADFISGTANTKYYDSGWNGQPRSHTFVFEEVTYPNEVKFASTNGKVTGADYVATFSAPFATIIPEGVTAYIVKTEGTTATLTPIEGAQAIPARTGVILTSTDGATARMVPAADETTATVADNELGHSAGAALELTAESGYILGQRDGQIAFYHTADGTLPMNHAYLCKSADQSVQSIQMVFTPATGIGEAITTINTVNAPIYDLAGRRVMNPAKGGVYIQNGRKFIVK